MNVVDTGKGISLYTIVGESGKIYYVGITGSFTNRMSQHRQGVCKFINEPTSFKLIEVFMDEKEACVAERNLISKLTKSGHPILNWKKNSVSKKEKKKIVSYYLKTENDEFLKRHAKEIGRSKNYILDLLIKDLRLKVEHAKSKNK